MIFLIIFLSIVGLLTNFILILNESKLSKYNLYFNKSFRFYLLFIVPFYYVILTLIKTNRRLKIQRGLYQELTGNGWFIEYALELSSRHIRWDSDKESFSTDLHSIQRMQSFLKKKKKQDETV